MAMSSVAGWARKRKKQPDCAREGPQALLLELSRKPWPQHSPYGPRDTSLDPLTRGRILSPAPLPHNVSLAVSRPAPAPIGRPKSHRMPAALPLLYSDKMAG